MKSPPTCAPGAALRISAAALLLAAMPVFAQVTGSDPVTRSDVRVNELEREVRELRQQNRDLARRIDVLERALGETRERRGAAPPSPPGRADDPALWTQGTHWERIETGMTEPEILEILGPPTSYRDVDDRQRILFYAMEIGPDGFLAGRIALQQGEVVDVQRPRLR